MTDKQKKPDYLTEKQNKRIPIPNGRQVILSRSRSEREREIEKEAAAKTMIYVFSNLQFFSNPNSQYPSSSRIRVVRCAFVLNSRIQSLAHDQ